MSHPRTLDVHAHFFPPVYLEALKDAGLKTLDGGIPIPDWTPERALACMDDVGIAGAVLSVSSPHVSFLDQDKAVKLCRSVNDYAAEVKRRYPNRFGAYAILPLPDMDASLTELGRALDELQLDGVALPTSVSGIYLGDARLGALLGMLDERRVTTFIHPTCPCCFEAFGLELPGPMIEFPFETTRTAASLLFSGALARHPGINFILPHAGGTLPFLAPRISAVGAIPAMGERAVPRAQAMQAFTRFFYDTAASVTPQQITALRSLAPMSQIVYGSDFPFASEEVVRMAEAAFTALDFTAEQQEMVRHGNATRLFETFARRCYGVEQNHDHQA